MSTSSKSPRKKSPPRRRNPKGAGTVERLVRNGREIFRARKQSGGKSVYGTVRDTWEEANADLATLAIEGVQSWSAKEIPTLATFAHHVLQGEITRDKEYGTWARQETIWRNRIDGSSLGRKRIDKIDSDDCQRFILAQRKIKLFKVDRGAGEKPLLEYRLTNEPLAESSLQTIGAFLSVVFEYARRSPYKFIESNPASRLEYPKAKKRAGQRKSLAPREAAGLGANLLAFITSLGSQGARFEAMVLTARDTGMRSGEICALKWDRVRVSRGVPFVTIDAAQVRSEGGIKDSGTKTAKVRELPIARETYDRIMAQPRVKGSPYVFTTESGKPVRRDNFYRTFVRFRNSVGMPDLKLHNLRHTYISLMLRAGVDLKTIQKQVGHATPRMIMEIYGETFDESQVESVGRFMDVLRAAEAEFKEAVS